MKNCKKCNIDKNESCFDNDKTRADGKFSYCKDCRRFINGSKKMPPREPRNCTECNIVFYPRQSQVRDNKTGRFFCCTKNMQLWKDKNASTYYRGYRNHILERDNYECVICKSNDRIHIHHIVFRSQGGTDCYRNLVCLCSYCHLTKAHGTESRSVREYLLHLTSQFIIPEFWEDLIIDKTRSTRYIKESVKNRKKRFRESIKSIEQKERYKKLQAIRRDRLKSRHLSMYGCSYSTIYYKAAKIAKEENISVSKAMEILQNLYRNECNTSGSRFRKQPTEEFFSQ